MFVLNTSHINTHEFSPEATRFKLNALRGIDGYISAPRNSPDWKEYWDLQEYYCTHGYSVGGVRITGEHYFYLNFCQIELKEFVVLSKENVTKKRIKQVVDRKINFPAFWDSDWFYFTESELAAAEGQHMIVLKPRRRGYSFKNAAKCAYKYTFLKGSASLILAELEKFSKETMRMAVSYLDFLIKYTDFGKQRQRINRPSEEVEASFIEKTPDGREIVGGFRSRIMAMTTHNNASVARGKGAALILFEEAGSFSNLLATYNATRATVEEGLQVNGQLYVYGTGGDFTSGQVDFEKMFYDPDTYNFRAYNNEYDEGKSGTQMGYFIPDHYNKGGFTTEQGISETEAAFLHNEALIEDLKRKSKDPNSVDAYLAEFPNTPAQAFIKVGTNIFPKAELNQQINEIRSRKELQFLGTNGILLTDTQGKVKFEPSDDAKPILNFPYKPDVDGEGCIIQYQPPHLINGEVPDGLYYIAVDPFDVDKGKDKKITRRDSIGAAYVFKRINNFSKPFDLIVCEYVARPHMKDTFNQNLFLMADYYNAKIVFESDRDGDIPAYARIFKKLHRLEEELTVYDSNDSPRNKLGRRWGVSMSNLEVKKTAVSYYRDWLLSPRDKDINGIEQMNLNVLYSIPLLEETIKFSYDGNYDRVSAMLVAMLYKKELLLKPQISEHVKSPYDDEFFHRFQNRGNSLSY